MAVVYGRARWRRGAQADLVAAAALRTYSARSTARRWRTGARLAYAEAMLASEAVIAFVATTRPAEARAFYEGTLGLRVLSDDDMALVLDAGGTALRVQKVHELAPAPFTALGWQVRDIAAVIERLSACGVSLLRFPQLPQDARGVWRAPGGAQICWFHDPDGNTLSLTQV
jgi:catechol 2,3-dioxygenase-like lactoylglutathione lyase family enzyme